MHRQRLSLLILGSLAVVFLSFAPAATRLGWGKTACLMVVTGVCLGLILNSLVADDDKCQKASEEAASFQGKLIWALASGFCCFLAPLFVLLPLNIVAWAGVETVASTCGLAREALLFGPWNLTALGLLGIFYPVKTTVAEMTWRVIRNHDAI